ncbi:synaptotagmin-17 [Lepisosteus oculatus]|uniref:Synaptotagmin-17 n=1 Tax=Lepisosteus oculatus TaxID=7918 RepID=W5MJN8_LEPOC|nr:PREDICTED: synaptotagmin-17 [Lepisosteus oculatus]XP_015216071.1 PREDICTED: synaptotagmin-17 [Lepisosteus oculatus]XP_015216072.1 PREDICTED: synaptotagmin-17 [Lepisosteus oculatus]
MSYIQLEPINEGLLSRLSNFFLCRWTCWACLQSCWECSCCQPSDEEVEILGPFPAQTPSWLVSDSSGDKEGDSDVTASDPPATPQDSSPDGRRSSSDTSRSTYSLAHRLSSLEVRRPSSPLVDIKPIEFWAIGSKKEAVQPSVLRKPYVAAEDYFRKFEPRLYSVDSSSDDMDSLTDDEILSRYQLGMLHFSTQYDLLHNHLSVRVIEARDLPPPLACDGARQDMAHSNPYVKMSLLPDQKNSRQTGVKRKTQNPVFEERFTFDLPFLEAQRRTLLLSVVDFDKFSRHCVIGKVAVPLSEVDLVKGGHWWKALVPSAQNEVELGELLLSLNHLPSAGRLNVEIIRAKQLLQTDMSQGSDPFVKVQLVMGLKLVKTKKTACMRGTIDPFFNESFSFRVTQEELQDVSLVLTVYGHNMKSSNDFVGRIVIGRFSTGPPESSHWRRLLSSQRTPVEQWHSLRSRAECDRVSPASLEVT